jgi:putative transposase
MSNRDELSPAEALPQGEREPVVSEEIAEQLLARAEAEGVDILGPDGLLGQVSKAVLERALSEELTDHLGDERHDPAGRGSGNSRNGSYGKRLLTDLGPVDLEIPRDREGSFEPKIVPKGSRRLEGFNDKVIALYARGMTTRDIQAHLREMYQVRVSPDLISRVTDAVVEELTEWQNRPLDSVWPVIFIDALNVKIRDGIVANRPVYVAIGVDLEGRKHVLGLWVGKGDGESAKFWLSVLAELKNRGVADVCILCCDGLKGLPDAVTATWPATIVQTCVVHLIRASLRYASRKYWPAISAALRPVYTAVDEPAAEAALADFADRFGARYPAIVRLWRTHWGEFIPFLAFPPEVRRVVYTTNLIESINARLRKVVRTRGHFPSEQAALKVLYLAVRNLDSFRSPSVGTRSSGWKQALQAFTIYFEGRIPTP